MKLLHLVDWYCNNPNSVFYRYYVSPKHGCNMVQTAHPEHKKGEWVPEFDGKFTGGAYWFSCSKCKRIVPDVRNGGWNYCPNCGAKMGVVE